jgi:hypothetical protein
VAEAAIGWGLELVAAQSSPPPRVRFAWLGVTRVGRALVESWVPVDASAEPEPSGGRGDGPAALASQSITVRM